MSVCFKYELFPPAIQCVVISDDNTPEKGPLFYSGNLKLDTGSDITCLNARDLGISVSEEEFSRWIQTHDNLEIIKNGQLKKKGLICVNTKGIDKTAADIKAYCYQMQSFTISTYQGSLTIGSVPVFITFDSRFQTPLLGRDILSLLNIEINNDKRILTLNPTKALSNNRITPQYFINVGIYDKGKMLISETSVE